MRHKIDSKLNNIPSAPSTKVNTSNIGTANFANAPQNEFKDFLKSKVHRPEVTPDFIKSVRKYIHSK